MVSKWFTRPAAALLAGCSALAAGSLAQAQVVISQAWGGANISASAPNADYVELFNRGTSAVSLAGWSVQVSSQGGTSWRAVNLTGSIAPRSYYLVQVEPTLATGTALPTPNASFVGAGSSPMTSLGGKVALRNNTTLLATGTPLPDATIIDFLGYGTSASAWEGAVRGPAGNTTGSGGTATRKNSGCTDTNNNGSDFEVAVPTPHNAASGAVADINDVTATASPTAGGGGANITLTLVAKSCAAANHPLTSPTADLSGFGLGTLPFSNSGGNVYTLNFAIPNAQGSGDVAVNYSANSPAGALSGQYTISVLVGNDLCSGAEELNLGAVINGDNSTGSDTGDGPNPTCQANSHRGIWYTFVAPSSGVYEFTTCGSGQDTIITVFTTPDCVTYTQVACDDDTCDGVNPPGSGLASYIGNANLTGGQRYYVRMSSYGTGATGGAFNMTVSGLISGACCPATGICTITSQAQCAGTFNGQDSTCSPNPCPPFGACCNLTSFGCTLQFQNNCVSPNIFQGDGSVCTSNPCPPRPNDECGGSVELIGNGFHAHATLGGTTGSNAASCGGLDNDVWYKWTAPADGNLRFWTLDFSDGGYALWTGDCAALVEAACADADNWMEFAVSGGTLYTIQVGQLPGGVAGSADGIEMWFVASSSGACCSTSGCTITAQSQCTGGSTFLGAGTSCVPPTATISNYSGTGVAIAEYSATTGGTFVTSTINVPDAFTVADVSVTLDINHTFVGDLIVTLEKDGRIINLMDRVGRTDALGFGHGSNLVAGSAYVFEDAGSQTMTLANAANGLEVAAGNFQPEYIGGLALNFKNAFNGVAAAGTWTLRISDWGPGDTGSLNSWSMNLTRGGASNCPTSGTGRCCIGSRCAIVAAASCVPSGTAGAIFTAGASNCNTGVVLNTPCCFADYNKVGGVTVQDVFDYLAGWFGNSVNANVSGNGVLTPTVQDIFDYLAAWFGGGC